MILLVFDLGLEVFGSRFYQFYIQKPIEGYTLSEVGFIDLSFRDRLIEGYTLLEVSFIDLAFGG